MGMFILKGYIKHKISIEKYHDLLSQIAIPASYFIKYFSFYLGFLILVPLVVLFYKKGAKPSAFTIAATLSLILFVILDFVWFYRIFYPS